MTEVTETTGGIFRLIRRLGIWRAFFEIVKNVHPRTYLSACFGHPGLFVSLLARGNVEGARRRKRENWNRYALPLRSALRAFSFV